MNFWVCDGVCGDAYDDACGGVYDVVCGDVYDGVYGDVCNERLHVFLYQAHSIHYALVHLHKIGLRKRRPIGSHLHEIKV